MNGLRRQVGRPVAGYRSGRFDASNGNVRPGAIWLEAGPSPTVVIDTRSLMSRYPTDSDTPVSLNQSGSSRVDGQGWGTCSATSNSSRLAPLETGGRGLSPGAVAWAAREGPAAHAWNASSLSHFV
ncbi:hypothetical protein GAR05_02401 [Micromonospora saelicesensis]|uniref:Uncharacterized protein n=1 Tax=Micromonospora saelicesensis TaxID=285676 RepID=A0ABX9CKH4_9ACTN|nr:hypothetical protein GAR05_02401 [Micromonospora saelicesensis]